MGGTAPQQLSAMMGPEQPEGQPDKVQGVEPPQSYAFDQPGGVSAAGPSDLGGEANLEAYTAQATNELQLKQLLSSQPILQRIPPPEQMLLLLKRLPTLPSSTPPPRQAPPKFSSPTQ